MTNEQQFIRHSSFVTSQPLHLVKISSSASLNTVRRDLLSSSGYESDEPLPFNGPDPREVPAGESEVFRRRTRAVSLLELAENVSAERRAEISREILALGVSALPALAKSAAGRSENAAALSRSLIRLLVPDEIGRQIYVGLLHQKNSYHVEDGAVQLARLGYPNLPVDRVLRDIDALGRKALDYVCSEMGLHKKDAKKAANQDSIEVIKHLGSFWRSEGFIGSNDFFYNERNSYLPDVLERHTGLPIAMSVLYLALARRVFLSVDGVGLPGHFIVRVSVSTKEGDGYTFIDPYHGARPVDLDECRQRVEAMGMPFFAEEHLKATQPRDILTRMCNNLLALFDHDKKALEAERVATVISHLQPQDPIPYLLRAERRLRRGEKKGARADYERARTLDPQGPIGRTAEELLRRLSYENPFQ